MDSTQVKMLNTLYNVIPTRIKKRIYRIAKSYYYSIFTGEETYIMLNIMINNLTIDYGRKFEPAITEFVKCFFWHSLQNIVKIDNAI